MYGGIFLPADRMAFWWCLLILGGTLANVVYEYDYNELEEAAGWSGGTGTARRACSSWCGCSGSIRSSYCCPTSYSTICEQQPAVIRPTRFENICTSRICRVLCPGPTIIQPSQPLGLSCTSHISCGEEVCCEGQCSTLESCVLTRRGGGVLYRGHAPSLPVARPTSRECTTDASCLHYGATHMCCEGQCSTLESCVLTRRGGGVLYRSHASSLPVARPRSRECTTDVSCLPYGASYLCCNGQCSTLESCGFNRPGGGVLYRGHAPSRHVARPTSRECTTDVSCLHYGANFMCCDGQCTSRSGCNPPGLTNKVELMT